MIKQIKLSLKKTNLQGLNGIKSAFTLAVSKNI